MLQFNSNIDFCCFVVWRSPSCLYTIFKTVNTLKHQSPEKPKTVQDYFGSYITGDEKEQAYFSRQTQVSAKSLRNSSRVQASPGAGKVVC